MNRFSLQANQPVYDSPVLLLLPLPPTSTTLATMPSKSTSAAAATAMLPTAVRGEYRSDCIDPSTLVTRGSKHTDKPKSPSDATAQEDAVKAIAATTIRGTPTKKPPPESIPIASTWTVHTSKRKRPTEEESESPSKATAAEVIAAKEDTVKATTAEDTKEATAKEATAKEATVKEATAKRTAKSKSLSKDIAAVYKRSKRTDKSKPPSKDTAVTPSTPLVTSNLVTSHRVTRGSKCTDKPSSKDTAAQATAVKVTAFNKRTDKPKSQSKDTDTIIAAKKAAAKKTVKKAAKKATARKAAV
jgi:ribonuclease E